MRSRGVRSGIVGVACFVAAAGLAGCATTSGRTSEELPSHRMTGMEPTGTVTRVDEPQQVIVLENGQMYRVSPGGTVYVDNQPVAFGTVRPGSQVRIVNGTPVVYQNGQYVVVQPSSSSSGAVAPGGVLTPQPTAVVTSGPPSTVVATAPAGTVVAAPATMRMTGRIVDVDRNEVKVKLDNGKSFEFRPPAGMVFRKGDPITIDMTIAGSPSALPR